MSRLVCRKVDVQRRRSTGAAGYRQSPLQKQMVDHIVHIELGASTEARSSSRYKNEG